MTVLGSREESMNAYETVSAGAADRAVGQEASVGMPKPSGTRPTAHAAAVECTCPDYCDLDHGND